MLRPDGTLWLNLGDSYAGSGKGYGGRDHGRLGRHAYDFLPGPNRRAHAHKPKDLIGIPWTVAFALRDDGWYLRSDIIWEKPNCLPESVRDRPTKSHEYVFLLTKADRYYYDDVAIREPGGPIKPSGPNSLRGQVGLRPCGTVQSLADQSYHPAGRNKRSVWTVATRATKEAHFATYPPRLIEPMILAGTSERGCCVECGAPHRRVATRRFVPQADVRPEKRAKGSAKGLDASSGWADMPRGSTEAITTGWESTCGHRDAESVPCVVLDPFLGSGTTAVVAAELGRAYVGIELSLAYIDIANRRLAREEAAAA